MVHKPWVRNLVIGLFCLALLFLIVAMRSVLTPVLIALGIAYVLDPVIDRMEAWRIPRTWGIVILCTLSFLGLLGFSVYVIPRISAQIRYVAQNSSGYLQTMGNNMEHLGENLTALETRLKGMLPDFPGLTKDPEHDGDGAGQEPPSQPPEGESPDVAQGDGALPSAPADTETAPAVADSDMWQTFLLEYGDKAQTWLKEHAWELAQSIGRGLRASFVSIGSFFGNILGLLIIPVLAFYLLRDFDIMTARLRDLIPLKKRAAVVHLCLELHEALSNFIKGQFFVALILSIIYTIGLEIADCPASLLIGVIAGFANLIPYLGIALGFVPAILLTYLSGNPGWQILTAGLTFVVGQMLEGMVITPKVVGESVGLHPVVVLVGLTIGGTYFGFVGMILALPATAVIMVLVRRAHKLYLESVFFHEGELDFSRDEEEGEPGSDAETSDVPSSPKIEPSHPDPS